MAGLLSGVLPAIYSVGDWAKRQVSNIASDPVGVMQQSLGQTQDVLNEVQLLQKQAFGNPANPLQVTDKVALEKLVNLQLNSPFSPGVAGMIGTRFKTGTTTDVPGFGAAKEIPDIGTEIKPDALKKLSEIFGKGTYTLQDVLHHPGLYRDYPEIAKYPVKPLGLFQTDLKGAYGEGKVYVPRVYDSTSPAQLADIHSTLLHEAQHAIQELDKMPLGGMVNDFTKQSTEAARKVHQEVFNKSISPMQLALREKYANQNINIFMMEDAYKKIVDKKPLSPREERYRDVLAKDPEFLQYIELKTRYNNVQSKINSRDNKAFKQYQSLAGEAQARAVQERFKNPEQYSQPVTSSYKEVPVENLTYRDPFKDTSK